MMAEKSLQEIADVRRLIAVDYISFGRVVLSFDDGSSVIKDQSDPDYNSCLFRDMNGLKFRLVIGNTKTHTYYPAGLH